jgi:hypothetical protein
MLIGFADNKGNPQTNQMLSNERAKPRKKPARGGLAEVSRTSSSRLKVLFGP